MRRAAVAMALLLGTLVPDPAAAAEGGAALPQGIEVRFGDDVAAQTRWHVTAALTEAWVTFAPHVRQPESFDALVAVVTNPGDAAREWAAARGISVARAERLFLARSSHYAGLATTGLTVIINDNYGDPGATIHEFAHLVQRHLAGGSSGPRWLSEGAAEYYEMLVDHRWGLDAAAKHPRAATRAVAAEWAATVGNCRRDLLPASGETCEWALASLAELESGTRFDTGGGAVSPYARAAVAFQFFADRYGEDAYFCFLDEQGSGSAWRFAFSVCTGDEIETFYGDFDRRRDRGFVRDAPARSIAYR